MPTVLQGGCHPQEEHETCFCPLLRSCPVIHLLSTRRVYKREQRLARLQSCRLRAWAHKGPRERCHFSTAMPRLGPMSLVQVNPPTTDCCPLSNTRDKRPNSPQRLHAAAVTYELAIKNPIYKPACNQTNHVATGEGLARANVSIQGYNENTVETTKRA